MFASILMLALVANGTRAELPLGYMLDISRDKVPTEATLGIITDVMAELGYSELQLYTEHTFAYRGHEAAWKDASPMTPDDIRRLDALCAKKGISLVANQNSFGHLGKWLEKPEYAHLAEAPKGGGKLPWGGFTEKPSALCVTDTNALALVESWYDELLPCFTSKLINIGGDEVFDLTATNIRSRTYVDRVGPDEAYLGFMEKLFVAAKKRGATPMFWADFFIHHTNLVSRIPKDVIAVDWGYDNVHPFEKMCGVYEAAGVRYRVAPGTGSWNALSGRVNMMMTNVVLATTAARRHGADGVLLTDWGDGGHPQPFLAALPGLVWTAACARGERLSREEFAERLDRIMRTKGGGWMLLKYGEVHLKCGYEDSNSTPLFAILKEGRAAKRFPRVGEDGVRRVLEAYHEMSPWVTATYTDETPDWVKDGFTVFNLLYVALERRLAGQEESIRKDLAPEYRRLWLKYNRPGGLDDSVRQLGF